MLSTASVLISAGAMALSAPLFETRLSADWQPAFTEPEAVQITGSTVALVTHSSYHFDPLGRTAPGVNRAVATMKRHGLPVLYLHDRYNDNNPAWQYLYDDWQPTAYLKSDIGHFDLDFSSVDHVVCLGGFYTLCQNNTVRDAVKLWQRDAVHRDFQITQVVDGIFDLGEGVRDTDPYRRAVRTFLYDGLKQSHSKAVMSLQDVLQIIDDEELAIDYLKRRLPPLPPNVDVRVDYFGTQVMIQEATYSVSPVRSGPGATNRDLAPPRPPQTLIFAYRTSKELLAGRAPSGSAVIPASRSPE